MNEYNARRPMATVDVSTLNTVPWGPIRHLFPGFVEELELARYLKRLLAESRCKAVEIQPHVDASGNPSQHVFDVFMQP